MLWLMQAPTDSVSQVAALPVYVLHNRLGHGNSLSFTPIRYGCVQKT